jgi:hypothetical protein
MPKVSVQTEIIYQELPDGGRSAFVRWEADCPLCGRIQLLWPAHHWRTLRDVLVEAIDLYPDLATAAEKVETIRLVGPPTAPDNN